MDTMTDRLIAAAEEVHSILGSNCSESTYHRAMERELSERGIGFSSEGTISIFYKGTPVGKRRPDMFVESSDGIIVVELKAKSNKGQEQLFNYQSILDEDENFDISGGILISFNDKLEIVIS